jgi:HTH-type transcriptional regulator / antitoxin HigA
MLKPINTDTQYEAALVRIYELMQLDNIEPDTPSGDELEVLTLLVKSYETKQFPIPKPHPLEAIKFRLDQMGLAESDLSKMIGSRSRKSEILSGQRKLSLNMIRVLHRELRIPASILIQAY